MADADRGNSSSDTCSMRPSFLVLPAEVRTLIYHHHLTSGRIVPRKPAFTQRWTPIDLLYVCRTIYSEAFYHLYTKGEFVLAIRPESVVGLATSLLTDDISSSDGPEIFVKSQIIRSLIRHIHLKIHWPSVGYAKMMDYGISDTTPTTNVMLKKTIATVGAMLSKLPSLRTVDVSWSHMTVLAVESTRAAPPRYRIPGWLRGLEQVRRTNREVLIRMPLVGPISTEERAKRQEIVVWCRIFAESSRRNLRRTGGV